MIRYGAATAQRISNDVAAHDPGWLAKARQRTLDLIAAGKYVKASSLWGDIKLVYMKLQHFKCIFCERPLAQAEAGSMEQDVEHFRPKSSIKAWPPRESKLYTDFTGRTGGASTSAYYWLAYDLSNYAASCKPCNTIRKSNFFPIAGVRGTTVQTTRQLNALERPYLIFPLIEDPEELITFEGIVAVARHSAGSRRDRALVTIDLLDLNGRGELIEDRFRTISAILPWTRMMRIGARAERENAVRMIQTYISDSAPQAACARAFLKLIRDDPQAASRVFLEAQRKVEEMRASRG